MPIKIRTRRRDEERGDRTIGQNAVGVVVRNLMLDIYELSWYDRMTNRAVAMGGN